MAHGGIDNDQVTIQIGLVFQSALSKFAGGSSHFGHENLLFLKSIALHETHNDYNINKLHVRTVRL